MTMAQNQKGKQATKGAKQILEENRGTLAFYRNMALGSTASFLTITLVFYEMGTLSLVMSVFSIAMLAGAHQFMAFMAKPKYSDTGALLDPGNDLNMEGAVSEEIKDLIILGSCTLILVLVSNYFWLLLLLVPVRLLWLLWGSVLRPWLSQERATEETEVDEKKQRKLERKMRRMR